MDAGEQSHEACGQKRLLRRNGPMLFQRGRKQKGRWRLPSVAIGCRSWKAMLLRCSVSIMWQCSVVLFALLRAASCADPSADQSAIVLSGPCSRFTLLTSNLIRMERAHSAARFDDRASFAVINRRLPIPMFQVAQTNSSTIISTASFELTHVLDHRPCGGGFGTDELTVVLKVPPFSRWSSGEANEPMDSRPSSVARVVPESANLNGTMNHGPSFEGGLDCYSNPIECGQQYEQIWGQGLLSRKGMSIVNDTNGTRLAPCPAAGCRTQWFDPASTRVKNHIDAEDLYLLVSGLEYMSALADFAQVSGAPSLPPLAALGVWYSRYYPYGATSYYTDIIDKYKLHDIPLSVGVLDVPWHNINYARKDLGPDKNGTAGPGRGCNGWDGFTFNSTLFPHPAAFFDQVHKQGLKMTLSVHMQNGQLTFQLVPAQTLMGTGIDHCQEQYPAMARAVGYTEQQIQDKETVNCTMDNQTFVEAFFENIVDKAPIKGTADYWWLDYPGGASEVSGWDQQEAASLYWSNRMFAEHARQNNRRPVILARYGGLGQQRDGLGFSGDTFEAYSTLEFQIKMTPAASNVLFGWYSGYEPGSHKPIPGPYPGDELPSNHTGSEMLLRWIQPSCDRYLWDFGDQFDALRAALRLRDALVPYIYTAGLQAYRTGVSLLRPMYYHFGRYEQAYSFSSQYMFGDNILVAPVATPADNITKLASKSVWLPPAANVSWLAWDDASPVTVAKTLWHPTEIPLFLLSSAGGGAIVPTRTLNSTHAAFVDPLVWMSWSPPAIKSPTAYTLYEDNGEGREYEDHTNTQHSTTQAVLAQGAAGSMSIKFMVFATVGDFERQHSDRQHLVQFRGRAAQPKVARVDGVPISKILPVAGAAGAVGWFRAEKSPGGRDGFIFPEGVLVVSTGRQPIRKDIEIQLTF